jgi:hypothetical protein
LPSAVFLKSKKGQKKAEKKQILQAFHSTNDVVLVSVRQLSDKTSSPDDRRVPSRDQRITVVMIEMLNWRGTSSGCLGLRGLQGTMMPYGVLYFILCKI